MNERYDFLVIGGGSAGYAGASTASRLGLRTAIVEGSTDVGGLCILRGCMPSKTLLESAHRAETVRRAAEFGLRAEYQGADATAILARKRRLIGEFASYRREQLETGKFDFIRGRARFMDAHTVEIELLESGESLRIEAKSFLVATGSRMNRVHLPGLDAVGCWDSDELLDATHIPNSVVVLGGGAIGLEFASYYAGLGREVTVLQRGPQLLKEVDLDVATALAEALEKRGVRVLRKTAIQGIERAGTLKRVRFLHDSAERSVEAEEIIYALGRKPETRGLMLERAGFIAEYDSLRVSATQQSAVPHIFAAGDVCGPFEVVHIAVQQGEIAARNAARLLRGEGDEFENIDYRLKVFAVFTWPEVATVGVSEREAAEQGIDFLAAQYAFCDHGKSMLRGETEGFVKLIVERDSRRIIGGAAIGPDAAELIHEITVAMHFRGTAADLARVPHYHPTLSEIWTYPAEELA